MPESIYQVAFALVRFMALAFYLRGTPPQAAAFDPYFPFMPEPSSCIHPFDLSESLCYVQSSTSLSGKPEPFDRLP